MNNERLDNIERAADVVGKAAKKAQDVPIGYMFIIMITVIAITWYVSYKSYANRYEDCKAEKRRLEDYFVYKQMRQEDTIEYLRGAIETVDSILRDNPLNKLQR